MTDELREIAGFRTMPIGFGCMNLSHAYGTPLNETDGIKLLHNALDLGVTHFDTAALYGFGENETLLGKALARERNTLFLASKCGMSGVNGKRVIDGRPDTIKQTVTQSLQRLNTDVLDLCYLHRVDKNVPIEESIGALADLVRDGKIKAIGLSEVSVGLLKRAQVVHQIAAVQSEYSLWTRNAELAMIDECHKIGAAFVAFSPLARGFLASGVTNLNDLADSDLRKGMPRFQEPHFSSNLRLLEKFKLVASDLDMLPSQLALAWVLHQGEHIFPIPGTTSLHHLTSNMASLAFELDSDVLSALNTLINQITVSGARYTAATQAEIDTEEFAD